MHTRSEVLHWDGRLDNRADLLLQLRDSLNGESSDAAVARATYDRWGTEGLVHLIGDWSLVIHDHERRTTVLASDFAGVRPLYYHVQDGRVQWSNRLQYLVEETGITDLDEQYIAGFLTFGGCANRTPYKGIYSVPRVMQCAFLSRGQAFGDSGRCRSVTRSDIRTSSGMKKNFAHCFARPWPSSCRVTHL